MGTGLWTAVLSEEKQFAQISWPWLTFRQAVLYRSPLRPSPPCVHRRQFGLYPRSRPGQSWLWSQQGYALGAEGAFSVLLSLNMITRQVNPRAKGASPQFLKRCPLMDVPSPQHPFCVSVLGLPTLRGKEPCSFSFPTDKPRIS